MIARYTLIIGVIILLSACGVKRELELPKSQETAPLPSSTSTTTDSK